MATIAVFRITLYGFVRANHHVYATNIADLVMAVVLALLLQAGVVGRTVPFFFWQGTDSMQNQSQP